jgi:2-methylisocitrate lyase-like PEP mutase family enzyme
MKKRMTSVLREKIASGELIIAPGVYDGLSALLAKRAGFPVLYASGGAIARSAGFPDIGLLTMTEVTAAIGQIVLTSQLPVIADADTGFGNSINVWRMIQEFERLGVAGLHLEDQTFPKRCGHLNDKTLVSIDEMRQKVKVARETIQDPDLVLIARTDAIAVEGFESALNRVEAYLQAGADMIFVEAPETVEQIETIAERIKAPKLINMFAGGKTPIVPVSRLKELGYQVVIIPSDLQRAAIKAMQNTLSEIAAHGNSIKIAEHMVSFKEREQIVETDKYFQIDKI